MIQNFDREDFDILRRRVADDPCAVRAVEVVVRRVVVIIGEIPAAIQNPSLQERVFHVDARIQNGNDHFASIFRVERLHKSVRTRACRTPAFVIRRDCICRHKKVWAPMQDGFVPIKLRGSLCRSFLVDILQHRAVVGNCQRLHCTVGIAYLAVRRLHDQTTQTVRLGNTHLTRVRIIVYDVALFFRFILGYKATADVGNVLEYLDGNLQFTVPVHIRRGCLVIGCRRYFTVRVQFRSADHQRNGGKVVFTRRCRNQTGKLPHVRRRFSCSICRINL